MRRLDKAHPCVLKWMRVPRRRHDYAVESGNGSTYMNIINRWKNEKFLQPVRVCVCVCRSFLNKAHPFHPVYWLLSFVMGIKTCYFYLSWDPLEHLSPLRDSVRWIFEFINLDDAVFFLENGWNSHPHCRLKWVEERESMFHTFHLILTHDSLVFSSSTCWSCSRHTSTAHNTLL